MAQELPIGIEVTQPKIPGVFKINSAIEERVSGKEFRSPRRDDPAGKALRIVAGDPGAERILRVRAQCSIDQTDQFYLEALSAKKTRKAYLQACHQLQLTLFEPK